MLALPCCSDGYDWRDVTYTGGRTGHPRKELSDLQQSQLPEHGDGGPEHPQPLRPAHQVLGHPALGPQRRGQDARRDPSP